MIHRKMTRRPLKITYLQNVQRKNTNYSHVKNAMFSKVRKCALNIDSMLNFLHKKDQNIYFTSDLYKGKKKTTYTETKKSRLTFNNKQTFLLIFLISKFSNSKFVNTCLSQRNTPSIFDNKTIEVTLYTIIHYIP